MPNDLNTVRPEVADTAFVQVKGSRMQLTVWYSAMKGSRWLICEVSDALSMRLWYLVLSPCRLLCRDVMVRTAERFGLQQHECRSAHDDDPGSVTNDLEDNFIREYGGIPVGTTDRSPPASH